MLLALTGIDDAIDTERAGSPIRKRRGDMVLLLLLLVAILFGLGFVVKWLFVVAAVLFILWIAGWLAHSTDRRWYYW